MGLWGVWVLGIGDAMGAMIGKSFGRHRWGSNSRTIEGSMAMFLSLCLVCVISIVYTPNTTATMQSETPTVYSVGQWLPAVVFVTLIEAYTLQIDNIVLPFAGATMILVCQSIILKLGVNA
jgi:dolichol kinase